MKQLQWTQRHGAQSIIIRISKCELCDQVFLLNIVIWHKSSHIFYIYTNIYKHAKNRDSEMEMPQRLCTNCHFEIHILCVALVVNQSNACHYISSTKYKIAK